ncbi:MAG: MarR family transcriptional regulator [Pirellulaceae bacterium]
MAAFTPTQGRYLAFIHQYIQRAGCSPAESEIASALCVMPPSVNQMIRTLEQRELISRVPGKARSIKILLYEDEIPIWNRGAVKPNPKATPGKPGKMYATANANTPKPPTVDLYVLNCYIAAGPVSKEFQGKRIARVIEFRADNTLDDVHEALSEAFGRQEDRPYEFNIGGTRRFCPENMNYGFPERLKQRNKTLKQKLRAYDGDSRKTKLLELSLSIRQSIGYSFDFVAGWYHFLSLEKIERAIPTVDYPRLRRQVGKAPPQFDFNLDS